MIDFIRQQKLKSLRYQKGFMWLVVIVFVKWAYLDCTQSILFYFCFTLFFFFHFWDFALAKLGGSDIMSGLQWGDSIQQFNNNSVLDQTAIKDLLILASLHIAWRENLDHRKWLRTSWSCLDCLLLVLGHFQSNFAYIFITQFTFFLNKDSHIKESMYVNPLPKKRDTFCNFFYFLCFWKNSHRTDTNPRREGFTFTIKSHAHCSHSYMSVRAPLPKG